MSSYEEFLTHAKQEKRKDDLQDTLKTQLQAINEVGRLCSEQVGQLEDLFKLTQELHEIARAKIKKGETHLSKFTIPSINSGGARFIYFDLVKGDRAGGSFNIKELTTKEIDYPYSKCFSIDIRNEGPAPIQFRINPKGQGDRRLSGELEPSEIRSFNSDIAVYHGVNIAINKSDIINEANVEIFCET